MLKREVGKSPMENSGQEDDSQARQQLALLLFQYLRTAEQVEEPHHRWVRWIVPPSVLALVVLGVWVGGNLSGVRYELHGKNFWALTDEAEIEDFIESKIRAYRLPILQPDGTRREFTFQEMGLVPDIQRTMLRAHEQRGRLEHRLQWWRPVPIELVVHEDTVALKAFIAQHASVVVEPATDATINLVDGTVQITDGRAGKQYGLAESEQTIRSAVSAFRSNPLLMRQIALQPDISAHDLAEKKAKLEAILKQSIVVAIDERQVRPGPRDIAAWIVLMPNPEAKDVALTINVDQVRTYINKLAADHTQPARAQVTLSSGAVVAGSRGVTVTGTDTAVESLSKNVLKAEGVRVDLPVKATPFKTITAPGAGKWIEVDVTNKRMYAYEQDTLVRTFLVSAGRSSTPTVTGTFAIYRKLSVRTMTGPGYSQPNVPWVNYFYRDYAIHGNYWRPARYFGAINSSHGCVGLKVADSAWVYEWAPVGTAVVIHL